MSPKHLHSLANKDIVRNFKRIDWDFTGENGSGGFAAYHWYPARFVPQLAGILIGYFSAPRELVLDPFVGSGTTLIEAYKLGRRGIGIDINPVATLMSRAKLTRFDERGFGAYKTRLSDAIRTGVSAERFLLATSATSIGELPPNYQELQFWFHPDTLRELVAIWAALSANETSKYSPVGLTAFSSILKYACSQDKHWGWVCDNVRPKEFVYRSSIPRFLEKLDEFRSNSLALAEEVIALQEASIAPDELQVTSVSCIDVMAAMSPASIDLIVTSPPYYNMTDYVLSQRLSNLWFDVSMPALRQQ